MAMRYANLGDVLDRLKIEPGDTERVERVERLEAGLAAILDDKMGRSFGAAPEPETRDILVDPVRGSAWFTPLWENLGYGYRANLYHQVARLVFPVPVRSLVGVTEGGSWNGTAWVDPDVVAGDGYRLANLDSRGYAWAIDRLGGALWSGVAHVEAIWDDQTTDGVPPDVVAAMTFLVCDEWRLQESSPAGQIGPDGLLMGVRDPWNMKRVRSTIEHHQIARLVV